MKLSHLTADNRAALRTLRDCGIITASGKARTRFNDLVRLGYANAYHVADGMTDYRLNHGGKSMAGVVR
jgi:hypothetical protein